MCGITGLCNLSDSPGVSPDLIGRMLQALVHRGPDGSGIYVDNWAGLGHARLSIIDPAGGAQPIHNEDETLWIVYNGEVFNYPELRRELIEAGHRFYTGTDTEVILHLYEDQGPACLNKLNGQFAIAIWNGRSRELFLARDRVGILPLHYTISGNRLLFASEIKSLFMDDRVDRNVDPIALDQIFHFWTTLPGRTFFRDIHELKPGHYLLASNGQVTVSPYWELSFQPPSSHLAWPVGEITDALKDLVQDAVRIRLRADVPVGCYLSGGLDSSGIAAVVKRKFDNRLRTFGIGFDEEAFDEGTFQRTMVAHLGTDHTSVRAVNEAIGTHFRDVLWHCEKPLLRTAPVPLYLLSRAVRDQGFKVVLTGEGADEIFGGYNIFREAKIRRFWAVRPESKMRPRLIARLYPYVFGPNPQAKHLVNAFFGNGIGDLQDPFYSHTVRWRNTARIKTFFSPELKGGLSGYSCIEELAGTLPKAFAGWEDLARAQYLEYSLFLGTYLLSSQGDRVSMANGVEVRPPFLDHRIIEFMAAVPSKWKIRVLNEKYLLKRVFQDLLPESIVSRPKHPYRAPIRNTLLPLIADHREWMRTSIGRAGLFDREKTEMLFAKMTKQRSAGEVESMALAGILSTQLVYERFIEHFVREATALKTAALLFDRRSGRRDRVIPSQSSAFRI